MEKLLRSKNRNMVGNPHRGEQVVTSDPSDRGLRRRPIARHGEG